MNERRLRGDGIELTATEYGDPTDPPILLLHGGGQTRHAWGTAGEAFARRGRYALSVDLRGHGDSDWAPDGDYGIDAFARDVRAVAEALTQLPVVVGASLGGLASLIAIGESAEPVASALVLVDVTPTIEMDGALRIRRFMLGGMDGFASLDEAADAIAAFNPNRPRPSDLSGLRKNLRLRDGRWHWHWDPRFIRSRIGIDGQQGPVNHDRLAAAAARITVPTLLVRGRMSDIVSEEGVAELRELVPHAEVVDVAGAGHMVAGDRNDVFNESVIEFVDRTIPVPPRPGSGST
ncbi:MAG: alpha/beta hydrolase [Acidimicrobiia bacterium]|nr:alpha/beta hydrolase [Acidimicrobiia bacterium]